GCCRYGNGNPEGVWGSVAARRRGGNARTAGPKHRSLGAEEPREHSRPQRFSKARAKEAEVPYWLSVCIGRPDQHPLRLAIGIKTDDAIRRSASRKRVIRKMHRKCPRVNRLEMGNRGVNPLC